MQNEIQVLDKEVKLICEAVNSLKNELNYECVNKESRKHICTYADKLKVGTNTCHNCTELKLQLQSALEELNSVNLINSLLQEEIKTLSQTPYGISKDNNAWSTTKTNSSTATRPLKTTYIGWTY